MGVRGIDKPQNAARGYAHPIARDHGRVMRPLGRSESADERVVSRIFSARGLIAAMLSGSAKGRSRIVDRRSTSRDYDCRNQCT